MAFISLFLVPIKHLGLYKRYFIDENALSPPGVATNYFSQHDLAHINQLSDYLSHSYSQNTKMPSEYIYQKLWDTGAQVATQRFTFYRNSQLHEYTNVYAIVRAPRSSGSESILISAPWTCPSVNGSGKYSNERFSALGALIFWCMP